MKLIKSDRYGSEDVVNKLEELLLVSSRTRRNASVSASLSHVLKADGTTPFLIIVLGMK